MPLCIKTYGGFDNDDTCVTDDFLYAKKDAILLHNLASVSGIPKIVALHFSPPGIIMTFHPRTTLEDFLLKGEKTDTRDRIILTVYWRLSLILQAVHRSGYTHNDLTPENVSVGVDQGKVDVTLLDFGSAKKIGEIARLFNWHSCSPEVRQYRKSTPASDTYEFCNMIKLSSNDFLNWFTDPSVIERGLSYRCRERPMLRELTKFLEKEISSRGWETPSLPSVDECNFENIKLCDMSPGRVGLKTGFFIDEFGKTLIPS